MMLVRAMAIVMIATTHGARLTITSADGDPALLQMRGDSGSIDLSLAGSSTLSCSGEVQASEVSIMGSSVKMSDLIRKIARLEAQVDTLLQQGPVILSPPSTSGPLPPLNVHPPLPYPRPPPPPPPSPSPLPYLPRPPPRLPSPPQPPAAPRSNVVFDGGASSDLVLASGIVGRVQGPAGWNAAAWSATNLWNAQGEYKGIRFYCPGSTGGRMIGFVRGAFAATSSYTAIKYAINCMLLASHRRSSLEQLPCCNETASVTAPPPI